VTRVLHTATISIVESTACDNKERKMVNFKLGKKWKDGIFSLSRAWDREKICVPDGNRTHLSFFIITHGAFYIADPSSMQDACHNELSKYDLARHESPSSSVVRAPNRSTGGHGSHSSRGLKFFLCPTLVTKWIFHLSHFDVSVRDWTLSLQGHVLDQNTEKS